MQRDGGQEKPQEVTKMSEKAVELTVTAKGGVRYTVPSTIRPYCMDETQIIRFRVGQVYRNAFVAVYFDDKCVSKIKKPVLAPGEMEQVKVKKADILAQETFSDITICIEV